MFKVTHSPGWPDGNVAGAQKPLQTKVMQTPSYGCVPKIAVASTQQFHPCKTFGVSRENTIIWDCSHVTSLIDRFILSCRFDRLIQPPFIGTNESLFVRGK